MIAVFASMAFGTLVMITGLCFIIPEIKRNNSRREARQNSPQEPISSH